MLDKRRLQTLNQNKQNLLLFQGKIVSRKRLDITLYANRLACFYFNGGLF
jgi:hypothetical protein